MKNSSASTSTSRLRISISPSNGTFDESFEDQNTTMASFSSSWTHVENTSPRQQTAYNIKDKFKKEQHKPRIYHIPPPPDAESSSDSEDDSSPDALLSSSRMQPSRCCDKAKKNPPPQRMRYAAQAQSDTTIIEEGKLMHCIRTAWNDFLDEDCLGNCFPKPSERWNYDLDAVQLDMEDLEMLFDLEEGMEPDSDDDEDDVEDGEEWATLEDDDWEGSDFGGEREDEDWVDVGA